jgi:hypothetical protein
MPPSLAYKDTEYQSTHYNLFKDSVTAPLKSTLPPGVTRYAFDAAALQYMAIVGHEQVVSGDDLVEYIDPYELGAEEGIRKMPSAAVRPKNVEQLRGVLAVCEEYSIPVWTFSRGKNLGYGGPARQRLRSTGSPPYGQHHRSQRGVRICCCGAWSYLHRAIRVLRRAQAQSMAFGTIARLGICCRQYAGSRNGFHANCHTPSAHLRARSDAGKWRTRTHRSIRCVGLSVVAPLQIHFWAQHRRSFPSIKSWNRHQAWYMA